MSREQQAKYWHTIWLVWIVAFGLGFVIGRGLAS